MARLLDERVVQAGSGIALRFAGAAGQFALAVVVANRIGSAGLGAYLGWVSVWMLGAAVGRLGTSQIAVRILAEPLDQDAKAATVAKLRLIARSATLLSALAIAAAVLLAGQGLGIAVTLFVGIFANSETVTSSEILRGLRRVATAQFVTPFLTAGFPLAVVVVLAPDTSSGVLRAHVIGSVLASAVAVILLWKENAGMLKHATSTRCLWRGDRPLVLEAAQLLVGEFASLAASFLPGMLLPLVASPAVAGVFGAIARSTRPVLIVQAAVNHMVGPRIAGRETAVASAATSARFAAALSGALALPIVIPLLVVPDVVLGLFGNDFGSETSALQLFAVVRYATLLVGPVTLFLALRGESGRVARGAAAAVVVLFAGVLVSNSAFEASVAVAASIVVRNALALVDIRRSFGIWLYPHIGRSLAD